MLESIYNHLSNEILLESGEFINNSTDTHRNQGEMLSGRGVPMLMIIYMMLH